MWRLALLFLAIAATAGASDRVFTNVDIGRHSTRMVSEPGKYLTLSADCLKDSVFSCAAFDALGKAAQVKLAPARLVNGVNRGALLCDELGGKLAGAVDKRGNESTYCRFSDGSLIATGSLAAANQGR